MSFGIYVHIPYCLQHCHYCDFATYDLKSTLAPADYLSLLKLEIKNLHSQIPYQQVSSVYFGGGTPSLVQPHFIIDIINELANFGFKINADTEITIEINPGPNFDNKLQQYLESPINRYSVGAQTFSNEQLNNCGRIHSVKETNQTLGLLKKNNLNYSLDILFALPKQTLADLKFDIKSALEFEPKHISPYYLTVPKSHKLNKNRAKDEDQLNMFKLIKNELEKHNYLQYEISNFAQKGFESRHNINYWSDQPYWGIGLSSHSYFPDHNLRFWNPRPMNSYQKLIQNGPQAFQLEDVSSYFIETQYEYLKVHEQMTDFCHTHLRKTTGIPKAALRKKFNSHLVKIIVNRLSTLSEHQHIKESTTHWYFSDEGRTLANQIFETLCFTANEI